MNIALRTFLLLTLLSATLASQEVFPEKLLSGPVGGGAIVRAAVNPRLSTGVIFSADRNLRIISTETLTESGMLPLGQYRVTTIDLTASGQTAVAGLADGSIATWSLLSKAPGKTMRVHSAGVISMSLQDENLLYSVGADRSVRITDLIGGTTLGSVNTAPLEPTGIVAIPGGRQFGVLTSAGTILIYNVAGLALALQIKENTSRITSAAVSEDGSTLAVGTFDGQVYVWAVPAGTLKARLTPHRGSVSAVAFDPKNTWIVSVASDSTINILDGATARQLLSRRTDGAAWTQVSFVAADVLLASTTSSSLKRWIIRKTPPDAEPPHVTIVLPAPLPGNLPHRVYATEFVVRGIAWDNKKLAGVSIGPTPLVLSPLAPTDTIALPPDAVAGVFTTTIRLDTIGVNSATFTATDGAGLASSATVRIDRISPADAVEVLAPLTNAEVDGVSAILQFRSWFEVATYSVSVNLIDVIRSQRPKNKRAGDVIGDEIPLVVGYNQVQLSVLGTKGERMSRTIGVSRKYTQTVVQAPAAAPKKRTSTTGPQQWAVIIGVSEYREPGIPALKYADKDAEAFANFLRTPEGGGYDNEHMKVLLNKDATLPNVRDGLINFLSNAIDMDLVMIYFAGHGAPEPARPQNLYLLTHDSDPNRLGTTAFPMWQIQDVLGRYINAKRIIVFSDACHSGGISVNFATRGVGVTEQNLVNQYLADLSRSKEGTVVFTASAAGEVSQEFPEYGHGAFTYFLLEGMRGKADYDNDYTITINEAMQYTEEQVKRKTRGAQNPTRSQTDYDKEMTVALIPH